ncbi:hypothetical protein [Nitrosospira briensis]|nr:hypothetical protein [Nitrosospira briensis]
MKINILLVEKSAKYEPPSAFAADFLQVRQAAKAANASAQCAAEKILE